MIETLLEAARLKAVARAGWVRAGVPSPESVAAHSWGVAWLVLVLLPPELDRERALSYAILHDLAEVRTGDLTPTDGVSREQKIRREAEAMADLCRRLPAVLATWQAYEAQADAEARFVRQLDRLDMAIQAVVYANQTPELHEFIASAAAVVDDPSLRPLLEELERRLV